MSKADNATITRRISTIYKLMLKGLDRGDIRQYMAEKGEWEVSERQLDRYIADAVQMLKDHAAINHDEEYGKALARIEDLYKSCMSIQDYKAALSVLKEGNELRDLYPAKKLELTGQDGGAIPITLVAHIDYRAGLDRTIEE